MGKRDYIQFIVRSKKRAKFRSEFGSIFKI
ncbi:hypothetical protein FHPHGOJG_02588 [Mannheimia haemolytica]